MRRIFACLLCVLLLAGCGAGIPGEVDQMVSIPEQMGLGAKSAAGEGSAAFTLSTEWAEYDPSIGTVWFTLENHSGGDIETGVDHTLECYVEEAGAWYQVPMAEDAAWIAIALSVPDGEAIALSCALSMFDYDFSGGGLFRIAKTVEDQTCTAEFRLTPGAAVSADTPYGLIPLENLSPDYGTREAAEDGCPAFTWAGAENLRALRTFLEKVRLGIPCQLRTVQDYGENAPMVTDAVFANGHFQWQMRFQGTLYDQRFSYLVTDGTDIYFSNGADWEIAQAHAGEWAVLAPPEGLQNGETALVEDMTARRLADNAARYKVWSADGIWSAALTETPTEFSVGSQGRGEVFDLQNWDGLETAVTAIRWEEDGTLRLTCKTVTGETSFLRFDPEAWELTSDPGVLPGQTSDHDTAEDLWGAGGALRVFLFCEEK